MGWPLLVFVIVAFLLFGLLIALLMDPVAKQAVGYVFVGLGGAAALGWSLMAMSTWSQAGAGKSHSGLARELNVRGLSERFKGLTSFQPDDLLGTWDTLVGPAWKYEPVNYQSRAVIFRDAGAQLKIQNCSTENTTNRIKCATAELKQVGESPQVLAVSYFPGAYGSLVVEALRDNLLVLSSHDRVWLLARRGRTKTDTSSSTEARFREAVLATTPGAVDRLPV